MQIRVTGCKCLGLGSRELTVTRNPKPNKNDGLRVEGTYGSGVIKIFVVLGTYGLSFGAFKTQVFETPYGLLVSYFGG